MRLPFRRYRVLGFAYRKDIGWYNYFVSSYTFKSWQEAMEYCQKTKLENEVNTQWFVVNTHKKRWDYT